MDEVIDIYKKPCAKTERSHKVGRHIFFWIGFTFLDRKRRFYISWFSEMQHRDNTGKNRIQVVFYYKRKEYVRSIEQSS